MSKSDQPKFTDEELRLFYALVHISITELLRSKESTKIETYNIAISARNKLRIWAGI